jgi:hypothetical protein
LHLPPSDQFGFPEWSFPKSSERNHPQHFQEVTLGRGSRRIGNLNTAPKVILGSSVTALFFPREALYCVLTLAI